MIDITGILFDAAMVNTFMFVSFRDMSVEDCSIVQEDKYTVFKTNLLQLFNVCPSCRGPCQSHVVKTTGTCVAVNQNCLKCFHTCDWWSQPLVRNIRAGNLLLSSAIACSGLSYIKTLAMLRSINVACIGERTYLNHFTQVIQPTVYDVWLKEQQIILDNIKQSRSELVLCGDGRCDSPGHNAKYGTYTMLDADSNKVIHFELTQVSVILSYDLFSLIYIVLY